MNYIKSYMTFLSRNKAYALINVFGLSISLMFVLIIGVYTAQEYTVDRHNTKVDRIYTLDIMMPDSTQVFGNHHYTQKLIRQVCPEVVATGAAGLYTQNLKRPDGEILATDFMVMDSTLFGILDFPLIQGNANNPLPDSRSAVVSESFAKRYFGEYEAMGNTIVFADSIRFRVTGVMAEAKNSSLKTADVYIGYANMKHFNAADMDDYIDKYVNSCGMEVYLLTNGNGDLRLKEKAINDYFAENFKVIYGRNDAAIATVTPLSDFYFSQKRDFAGVTRHGDGKLVGMLFAVGIVILLFAIINYTNLTVSQSSRRAREMATRRLFGGTRLNIVTQLMCESVTLCFISLLIAIVLVCIVSPFIANLLGTSIDLTLLLHPLAIAMILAFVAVVGVLSGTLPSVVISRTTPIEIVRGTFRFRTKMHLSRAFIVVQNIVTIVMLGVALVMTGQMRHIITAPLGYDTENVMAIPTAVMDSTLNQRFMQELRKLPSVVAVSACDFTPIDGGHNITQIGSDKSKTAQVFHVDADFFKMLNVKVVKDNNLKAKNRVWVNQRYTSEWSDTYDGHTTLNEPYIQKPYPIAGVLADFRLKNITNSEMSIMVFEDDRVAYPRKFLIKVGGNASEAFNDVARLYKQTFHMDMKTDNPFLDDQVAQQFTREVRLSTIVSLFAFVAVVVSMLGLIAMSTYFIQQRRKEIAVRKVFGSTGTQVRRRLIGSFMVYVAIAAVVAVPLAWHFASDWIAQYSYRISVVPCIAVAVIACALISLAAVYVQSYVAGNENPINNIKDNG